RTCGPRAARAADWRPRPAARGARPAALDTLLRDCRRLGGPGVFGGVGSGSFGDGGVGDAACGSGSHSGTAVRGCGDAGAGGSSAGGARGIRPCGAARLCAPRGLVGGIGPFLAG
ncbi:unnamed protein product, partial [Phaeothamnion confervicola]